MLLPLAKISLLMNVLIVLFIAIALLLILVILIQKGKGGGMGAMFGGLGASSLLGSKTGDFLTWVTISLVALFLVLAVLMDKYLKSQISSDLIIPPAQALPEQPPAGQADTTASQAPAEGAIEMPAGITEEQPPADQDTNEEMQAPPAGEPAEESAP